RSLARLPGVLALLALAGCAGIRVRRADTPPLFQAWRASSLTSSELSPRTRQTLRRFDLERVYARTPQQAGSPLHAAALTEPQPHALSALAELSCDQARHAEERSSAEACGHYSLCAGYAYHYLFNTPAGEGLGGAPDPRAAFDPRFRLACDLYNTGLAKFLAA